MNGRPASNTQTIARNSFWYGLELSFGVFAALVTSIKVARDIGPVRLAPFYVVMMLANVTTGLSTAGLAVTTAKYMAEYLNRGEAGVARAIYRYALRVQVLVGVVVTLVGVWLVFLAGHPESRLMSLLLVGCMAPRIIASIPSQAHVAGEVMQRNTWPSLLGGAITVVLTWVSLAMHWDLPGIAAAFALGTVVDMAIKLVLVQSWLAPVPHAAIPADLRKRMYAFSGQSLVLMLLNIVVWDKSDLFILKLTNPGIRGNLQVTFFSIAFSLTDRMLMAPSAFSGGVKATMMAQVGRGSDRVVDITVTGARYAFLVAIPLLVGLAAISRPFVLAVYHDAYRSMVPVLMITALMAVPKALSVASTSLFQAVERQSFLIWTGCLCGVIDIGLDFLLTPTYGAIGAACANGIAQTLAGVMMWTKIYRDFHCDLRLGALCRIALSGAIMAAAAEAVARLLPPSSYATLAASIAAGAAAWFLALRFTRALDRSDAERLMRLGERLPAGARPAFASCVRLLIA